MAFAFLNLWTEAQSWVNLVASAIIILLIGFIIGKVLGKLAQRFLHELELNRILKKAGIALSMEEFAGHAIEYFIYFIAIVVALDQLGITAFVLYIIVGLLALVIAAAFVLSIKDFIPNFIAGWRLSRKKLFVVGDTVTIGSVTGKVKEAGLLETRLQSRNDVIHIPNSILFKQEIRVRKK